MTDPRWPQFAYYDSTKAQPGGPNVMGKQQQQRRIPPLTLILGQSMRIDRVHSNYYTTFSPNKITSHCLRMTMESTSDIVVSVDFGTTFTGVAWMGPRTPIQVISDWPGSGDRGERKVPTTLIYNHDGSISTWGFMCDDDNDWAHDKTRRSGFKIFMDQETLETARQQGMLGPPETTLQAQQFVTDYLRKIYHHVKETIETQIGRRDSGGWNDMAVEFLFSVPTTWTSQDIINSYKSAIRRAGFGVEGPRHTAQVDLTEAEAAAVATLKTSAVAFKVGSVFLSVDAGGGTTDLAMMQVTSSDQKIPQMSSLNAVSGSGLGSTLIDRSFMYLVDNRLKADLQARNSLPPESPTKLARSHHFRTVKHKFGERAYMFPVFWMPMEGVSHNFSHSEFKMERGRMGFSRQEIQSLFDPQIERIVEKIIEQLDWLKSNNQPQQVEYMVLSGGLGSSVYVRETMQRKIMNLEHPNAKQVAVIPCNDPQLVVVRGLLLERQQRWETGGRTSVLAARIARASYGVIVQRAYSPNLYFNEDVIADKFDPKQKWVTNQIQWLIKKGDRVNPNVPLVQSFEIRLAEGETTRSWDSEIVISQHEPSQLPRSLKQAGALKLCNIKSNLTGVEQDQLILKSKRGTCFAKGYTFFICQFDVRVIVAPADLRFELWFGGRKFAGDHVPVTVTWDEVGTRLRAQELS